MLKSPLTNLTYSQSSKPDSTPFQIKPQCYQPTQLQFTGQESNLSKFHNHYKITYNQQTQNSPQQNTPIARTLLNQFQSQISQPVLIKRKLLKRKQKTQSCVHVHYKTPYQVIKNQTKTKKKTVSIFDKTLSFINNSTFYQKNKKNTPYLQGGMTKRNQFFRNRQSRFKKFDKNPFKKTNISIQLRGNSKPITMRQIIKIR